MHSLYDLATEAELAALRKKVQMNGSLHKLSSTNETIILNPRSVEYMLCESLNLENLSRKDSPIDALKGKIGFGIKTFLLPRLNDKILTKSEKVAEFKEDSLKISQALTDLDKIITVSYLRNQRLKTAMTNDCLNSLLYLLILRFKNQVFYYEHSYEFIDIEHIKIISSHEKNIVFTDNINTYSYKFSNSTLHQDFSIEKSKIKETYNIEKIYSPEELEDKLISEKKITLFFSDLLQSASGLNQGYAKGRKRDTDEIYIPIKSKIHKEYPHFFPRNKANLDMPFTVMLTNNKFATCKLCQSGRKALMSNPNTTLGKYILRFLLKVPKNHKCTINHIVKSGYTGLYLIKINDTYYLEPF